MPQVAVQRKSAVPTPVDPDPFSSAPRRTATGRTARPNATRPTNYYARPYASLSAAALQFSNNTAIGYGQETEHGFFPAIQFFSDAITALPRETVRQFTLMKEVEAKIHGPSQKMGELIDALLESPVPSRAAVSTGMVAGGSARAPGLLSLTANNSRIGSANVSVINDGAPSATEAGSAQNSIAGSVDGDASTSAETREELARRKQYYELRLVARSLLSNLDEKSVVLAEANRVMNLQMTRIDSVLPHIDDEISEDARLGSMTHWAYSDNRQKKQPVGNGPHSRAIQATNALASAASVMHEAEITQARREAVRDAAKDRQKGRQREQFDSDFDDRPRKNQKVGRAKPVAPQPTGLGIITNGEASKKRKAERMVAAGMERSASAKTARIGRESPRSTPAIDSVKKSKPRAAPPPKKKLPNSVNNSPALASSPLQNSFQSVSLPDPPPTTAPARPQSSRLRQNSSSNLRYERSAVESLERAVTSATVKANGVDKNGGKKKPHVESEEKAETIVESVHNTTETDNTTKAEEMDHAENEAMADNGFGPRSRHGEMSSKNGTPRAESAHEAPGIARTRSTRGVLREGGHESSSSDSQPQHVSSHKRALSNSHLVRQLAPYNRSPDLDRHRSNHEDDEDGPDHGNKMDIGDPANVSTVDLSAVMEPVAEDKRPGRRALSRRNTGVSTVASTNPSELVQDDEDDTLVSHAENGLTKEPELIHDTNEGDFEEDDSEHDPDDPDEPKYCYCNRGSYGEMVACDNENCAKEWFHLGCTELTHAPEEEEIWYCRDCRPKFEKRRGFRGGRSNKGI